MHRVITRPSLTWLLLVGLLLTSGILTATRGGLGPFNKAATCVGYGYGYATPASSLTLALSKTSHFAGTPVTASGVLSQGGCTLANETVHIQRRVLVNGTTPAGNWQTLSPSDTTDADGIYSTTVYSVYDSVFRAIVLPKGNRPLLVSNTVILKTHILMSVYAPSGKATTIARICGRVLPYKGGQRVVLYRYSSALAKWVPRQIRYVGTGSIYCFAVFLPPGRSAMLVSIPADTVNQRGLKRFYEFRS